MRFVLLIETDEKVELERDLAADRASMAEYQKYARWLADSGKLVLGERLRPERDAKRVTNSVITDGPFAETREVIGGVFVLECVDLAEALEIAAQCPVGDDGWVTVRPTW
ncbi:MAG: YciI family protein [bacterium]